MKTWLKGGLIGVGISLILIVYAFLCKEINPIGATYSSQCVSFGKIFFYDSFTTIRTLAGGFIIGAVIGLIIGKIKSKFKSKT